MSEASDRENELDALAGAESAACIVIDPQSSVIVAANPAGSNALGLRPAVKLPYPLDSAMPALKRLREIAEGKPGPVRETLNLWLEGKLIAFDGTAGVVRTGGGRQLVRLVFDTKPSAVETCEPTGNSADKPGATAEAVDVSQPAPPHARDDTETLRRIARRIREGERLRKENAIVTIADSGTAENGASDTIALRRSRMRREDDSPDRAALARIAHELKTPLSAIVAAAEIMRDERFGPMSNARYLDYASDIHDSGKHALDVVNDMLNSATGATGRPEATDLNALAEAAVSAMLPLAERAGLSLMFESDEDHLDVLASPTAIRQVLFNLVNNALKFTPSGGEVRVITGYLDDGSVYLVVRDTGEGMNEDELVRAFFSDASASPRRGGGFGLGLPMVRALAEGMGVALEADSAPGKGTAVLLAFPIVQIVGDR